MLDAPPPTGTRNSTRVPESGRLRQAMLPPTDSARSRIPARPKCGHRSGGQELGIEPDAVVLDAKNHVCIVEGEIQGYSMGTGVFADVGQRLAGNAEYLGLSRGRKLRPRGLGSRSEPHRELRRLRVQSRVLLQGCGHSPFRRHLRGETHDGLAHVHVNGPGRRGQFGEKLTRLGDATGDQHLLHGLRLRVDVAENLGEAVVHLAGDALPLTLDRQSLEFALQPGGLQRQPNLGRQGGQGFHLGRFEAPPVATGGRGESDFVVGPEEAGQVIFSACHYASADRFVAQQNARSDTGCPEAHLAAGPFQAKQRPVHAQK